MAKIKDSKTDEEIHHGRREKLRQSFIKYGLHTFNETQVLEFALGLSIPRIDTNPIAHRLINKFGSLNGVIDAHPDKLMEVAGVGSQSAFFLGFLKQFVTYYLDYLADQKRKVKIRSPHDACNFLREVMKTYSTEQFVLICLDKSGSIILQENTSSGDLDKVNLNLKNIVDIVLRVKTASVIVAHNHLDGCVTPSDADMQLTRYLINILLPLGIDVMDHIIFGGAYEYSFQASRVLEIFKREHKSFTASKDYEDYMEELIKAAPRN